MKRRLLTILAAFSLVLFVAVCALWVRSYSAAYDFGNERVGAAITKARLVFYRSPIGVREAGYTLAPNPPFDLWEWFGPPRWHLGVAEVWTDMPSTIVAVRFWALGLLSAVAPAAWLVRWRRDRRTARVGLCPSCGYDLRATQERCPECGAVPAVSRT